MKTKSTGLPLTIALIILTSPLAYSQGVDRADINNSNPRMHMPPQRVNNERDLENTYARSERQVKADNSRRNDWDKKHNQVNADQQSNDMKDIEITQSIRQELMQDGNLSVYAKNIKVVTSRGKVVVKGPVYSEQERMMVEQIARNVAGDQNVQNQITVTN